MLAEDICVKLRPILGEKVDRLWRAYLVEDTDGKREIEQILNMLYVDNISTDFYRCDCIINLVGFSNNGVFHQEKDKCCISIHIFSCIVHIYNNT